MLFNNLAIGPPMMYLTIKQFGGTGAFDPSLERFPDLWTVVWQVAVCLLVEDSMFYWCHRFLHRKEIYKHIHKHHHMMYHSVTLASENAHPVEYILGNLIPVAAGVLLLRAHVFVFWTFVFVRICETTDTHSGYEFPWLVSRLMPFAGATAAHDYHHSHNIGTYGSQFMFWDRIMGTDKEFIAYQSHLDADRAAGRAVHGAAAADTNPDDGPVDDGDDTPAPPKAAPAAPASAGKAADGAAPPSSGRGRRSKKHD